MTWRGFSLALALAIVLVAVTLSALAARLHRAPGEVPAGVSYLSPDERAA